MVITYQEKRIWQKITGNDILQQLYLSTYMAKALKRVLAHPIKQAAPMTPEILKHISRTINITDQVQLVSWTAILLGFIMFLRASNLVPDSMDSVAPDKQLTRNAIRTMCTRYFDVGILEYLGKKYKIQANNKLSTSIIISRSQYMSCILDELYGKYHQSRTQRPCLLNNSGRKD